MTECYKLIKINKMRRDGKTTRLIDEAIQMLFKDGEITILNNYHLFTDEKWKRGLYKDQIEKILKLVDPDAGKNNKAQFYFYDGVRRRLYSEHNGYFIESGNTFKVT